MVLGGMEIILRLGGMDCTYKCYIIFKLGKNIKIRGMDCIIL